MRMDSSPDPTAEQPWRGMETRPDRHAPRPRWPVWLDWVGAVAGAALVARFPLEWIDVPHWFVAVCAVAGGAGGLVPGYLLSLRCRPMVRCLITAVTELLAGIVLVFGVSSSGLFRPTPPNVLEAPIKAIPCWGTSFQRRRGTGRTWRWRSSPAASGRSPTDVARSKYSFVWPGTRRHSGAYWTWGRGRHSVGRAPRRKSGSPWADRTARDRRAELFVTTYLNGICCALRSAPRGRLECLGRGDRRAQHQERAKCPLGGRTSARNSRAVIESPRWPEAAGRPSGPSACPHYPFGRRKGSGRPRPQPHPPGGSPRHPYFIVGPQ
jgi:hypothetical protein